MKKITCLMILISIMVSISLTACNPNDTAQLSGEIAKKMIILQSLKDTSYVGLYMDMEGAVIQGIIKYNVSGNGLNDTAVKVIYPSGTLYQTIKDLINGSGEYIPISWEDIPPQIKLVAIKIAQQMANGEGFGDIFAGKTGLPTFFMPMILMQPIYINGLGDCTFNLGKWDCKNING